MHKNQPYRVPVLEILAVWQEQICKQMHDSTFFVFFFEDSALSVGRDVRIKCHGSLRHGIINCLGTVPKAP